MDTTVQARAARARCAVDWCEEEPGTHDDWHLRVLLTSISALHGSDSGAVQLVMYAREHKSPRPSIVVVDRDLRARPDRISLTPTWEQCKEISRTLALNEHREVWDMTTSRDRRPGALEVKPAPYGGPVELTVCEFQPSAALTAHLARPLAQQLSAVLQVASERFKVGI